jgi:MFS transporter, DHA2 family, multidrug resistance protein
MRPLLGMIGILIAAMTAEFNDQVTAIALVDVRGAFGISYDPGTWLNSLYVSAQIVGMSISAWFLVTLTLRRWSLFSVGLCGVSSVLIPFSPNIEALYALRLLQGLAEGLIIPLLMTTALRAFKPESRVYGLAVYALSASFTAAMAASLAALWTDIVDWRFVFLQAIPLCTIAAVLIWFGDTQDQPQYQRFHILDWRGVGLGVIGFGALSTMLYQGDRLDWFNSPLICVLALISVVAVPLFLINEWFHPVPLIKLQLLSRRNIAYGFVALFLFLIIIQSSTAVPLQILQQVQGYRPLQASAITLELALPQLILLPAVAYLLDLRPVDSRIVSFFGLALILAACVGASFVDDTWTRNQFYFWEAFQTVGQPFVIMPLLLMATNAVRSPTEAPFVAALINTPRAVAEAVGAWLLALIGRWRGALHSERLVDQIGQHRFSNITGNGVPIAIPPNGVPKPPTDLHALGAAVAQQVTILTAADTFLILGALTVVMMIVLAFLPVRTLPPRLELAKLGAAR